MIPEPVTKTQLRMLSRVDESPTGCWLWRNPAAKGYGYIWVVEQRRTQLVHRFSYETYVGDIPHGMQLDHLCRVRNCVNPAHLEPVTPRENVLRGIGHSAVNARKTRCPQGHEYTEENTYRYQGERHCRACARNRENARNASGPHTVVSPHETCQRGHPFSPENTYVKPNGSRHCLICKRAYLRAWKAKRRAS